MSNQKNNDNHRWDRVFEALGKLTAMCQDIKEDLAYHIKRTDLLEEKINRSDHYVKTMRIVWSALFTIALTIWGYLVL